MSESTTTTQIVQENPQIEAYRLGLLEDVQRFISGQITGVDPTTGQPVSRGMPPAYQVAGLSPMQQQAAQLAQQGIGSYQPYLQNALNLSETGAEVARTYGLGSIGEGLEATRMGQQGLGQALQYGYDVTSTGREDLARSAQNVLGQALQGQRALIGSADQFDPSAQVGRFYNPFEDIAVQQALQDVRREGDIAAQGVRAQAVGRGAFGGSRQAVAEQELERNVLEQQARTAAQMRQAGFSQASQQAQAAFENARRRQQQGAQLLGAMGMQAATQAGQFGLQGAQLGQQQAGQAQAAAQQMGQFGAQLGALGSQAAGIGQQLGQFGQQQAQLGALGQQMAGTDIQRLTALGGQEQALQQATLDAQRLSNLQLQQFPYQQYAFLSDIYRGTPSSQSTVTTSQAPSPSTAQQIAGLGIAGLSAAQGIQGLF